MAKIYYNRIKDGAFELENVPPTWYDAVKALLDADND